MSALAITQLQAEASRPLHSVSNLDRYRRIASVLLNAVGIERENWSALAEILELLVLSRHLLQCSLLRLNGLRELLRI
jgi:hypothetical protein